MGGEAMVAEEMAGGEGVGGVMGVEAEAEAATVMEGEATVAGGSARVGVVKVGSATGAAVTQRTGAGWSTSPRPPAALSCHWRML